MTHRTVFFGRILIYEKRTDYMDIGSPWLVIDVALYFFSIELSWYFCLSFQCTELQSQFD